jgi:(heptosyl)LPS beta-1,4-glucosyltransferase
MDKISGLMVVKNSPKYLFESLTSIEDLVFEFIIIDIGIEENIKPRLQHFNKVRIVSVKKEVPYIELIREESKRFVRGDYILFIDPDEIWMPGLKEAIKPNLGKYDYFLIPRKNLIFGKWIKHSRWWPDYQIRLFKKNKVVWSKEIHSQPKTSGKGLRIEAKEELAILHYNYQNIDEFFSKMTRYAKAEAGNLIKRKRSLTLQETVRKSIAEFISRYFAAEGYKDGIHGFVLAMLQMFYCFFVYFYYWEGKKYTDLEKKTRKPYFQIDGYFKQGLRETNYWLRKKRLVKGIDYIKKWIENIF